MQWTMNPLWKHCLFRKFTMDQLSFWTIKYEFRVCFANSVCIIYVIHYEVTIFLQNHYELTLIFHSMFTIIFFRWFTIDSLSFLRIHYKIMKSLSVSRIHNESIMFLANSLWIHYLFREYTINALSISRLHYLLRIN